MRHALRFSRAVIVVATFASPFAVMISCGPPELFLGAFIPEADASEDAAASADAAADLPISPADGAACDPGPIVDASMTITPFQSASCRPCALSACCSQMTACLLQSSDAAAACATYADCIDKCHQSGGADASPGDDASAPECHAACSHLGTSELYSELEACLAEACECSYF